MSQIKFFEVRDRMTCILVVATELLAEDQMERWFMNRGVGSSGAAVVTVTRLSSLETHASPDEWGNARTMGTAHLFIAENFDDLDNGQVVDVEFIKGEVAEPKISERLA